MTTNDPDLITIYRRTNDISEPVKKWSGPWQAEREAEIIAAAKAGYPNYEFVSVPYRRFETISPMGTHGYRYGDDMTALQAIEAIAA